MSRSFDVLYIGWSQAKGIWGDEFVHSVFYHIVNSRKHQENFVPEKLRISIKKMELNILKEISSRTLVRTFIDFQNIPIVDITYVTKIIFDDIIYVCLLVLGYDPFTGFPVHLYVYQMKNNDDANRFSNIIIRKTNTYEIRKRIIDIENMILENSQIEKSQLRNNERNFKLSYSSNGSNFNNLSSEKNPIQRKSSTVEDSKNELEEFRSKIKSSQCLSLPPRDYDTIHRQHTRISSEEYLRNGSVNHLPFSRMK